MAKRERLKMPTQDSSAAPSDDDDVARAAAGTRVSGVAPGRRPLLQFFAAIAAVVFLAVVAKQFALALMPDATLPGLPVHLGLTRDYLNSRTGFLERNDPETQGVFAALFPGYADILERLRPRLNDDEEFAVTSVLLEDGRQVRVLVPRALPFQLAAERTPDALIIGTSRSREGIRPDVLAETLGLRTVLNGSVSGANLSTTALLLEYFAEVLHGQRASLLLIELADVSLEHGPELVELWQRNIASARHERSLTGRIAGVGQDLLDYLPRLEFSGRRPLEPFTPCGNDAALPQPGPTRDTRLASPDAQELAALQRVTALGHRVADRVVFYSMPVSRAYQPQTSVGSVGALAAGPWLRFEDRPEAADVSERDFLGALTFDACRSDLNHLNTAAAVRFTRAFARALQMAPG